MKAYLNQLFKESEHVTEITKNVERRVSQAASETYYKHTTDICNVKVPRA